MKDKDKIATEIAAQIVELLKNKGEMEILPRLVTQLESYVEKSKIEVVSARSLTANEKEKVKLLIAKLAGITADEIEFREDSDLIDGMRIIYRDKVWDFSLKAQIANLV